MVSKNIKMPKEINFFKKIWYSTHQFEKYPQMSAYGVASAIKYFFGLIAIFSVLVTIIIFVGINLPSNKKSYNENTTMYEKIQQTFDVKIPEEQSKQITDILSTYDENVVNTSFAIAIAISLFISFTISTIVDIVVLSLFGLITGYFARIKLTYKTAFNMSVYALTDSIILNILSIALLIFFDFKVKYFEILYTVVSYICLAAAIFMIKSDLIKQQIELIKVMEEKKAESLENKEDNKDKDKENDDENQENKQGEIDNEEEQGSNA